VILGVLVPVVDTLPIQKLRELAAPLRAQIRKTISGFVPRRSSSENPWAVSWGLVEGSGMASASRLNEFTRTNT
jgi:hypothetical protein